MFPQDPEEFDSDERISFSRVSNTYILETEDGREFSWDHALRRWVDQGDEDEIARQQQAYAVKGVDEAEPAMNSRRKRKQTQDDHFEEGRQSPAAKKPRKPPQSDTAAPSKERKNTAVYVTNLPLDADAEEVHDIFSRCGVIAEEIDSGNHRIKLYSDDQDRFKGDALVVYFRPESVQLAIQMLDDTDFRLGKSLPAGRMRVVEADRSYKRQNNDDDGPAAENAGKAADTKSKREKERDKKKIIARTQKLNAKLADWDDDDPSVMPETSTRFDKVVILKHMFTLHELEEDPAAMLDIKEDIREECQKLGEVTNVVLYDRENDGVASVRFSTPEAARACVEVMDGRWFSGTQVVAYISKGDERFKKSNKHKSGADEDELDGADQETEDMKRAEKFGTWLEENKKEDVVDQNDDKATNIKAQSLAAVDPEEQ